MAKLRAGWRGLAGLLVSSCLVVTGGCDLGGGPIPPPPGPVFSFSPQTDSLTVLSTGYLDMQVSSSPPVSFVVTWTLDESLLGYGRNFRFTPQELGRSTLQANALYEDRIIESRWSVLVANNHPLNFSFDPAEEIQNLVQQETRRFQVRHQWPFTKSFTWLQGGQVVGRDSFFMFEAQELGVDSLRVEVVADGQTLAKSWQLTVDPYRPPPVIDLLSQDGPSGGSVEIIWRQVEAVVSPISGYRVAGSFSGPITEENWETALYLGRFEHLPGQVWGRGTFTEAEHGMIPGAQGWFAVRSEDDLGLLSGIVVNTSHSLSNKWWIEGEIRDDLGATLSGVTVVDEEGLFSVQTDPDGRYQIGPFPDYLPVVLRTETPDVGEPDQPGTAWHDYRTAQLFMETGQTQDLRLVAAYGAAPECATYQGSFINYFMYMTRTSLTTDLRPNQRLYKWDHYPLSVYIPGFTSDLGIDFQACCAQTLDIWNSSLEEDYFVPAVGPDQADIVFVFAEGSGSNGQTSLVLPGDQNYQLGDVIPEKMEILINSSLDAAQRVQETSLHELGHTLGLNRHSSCSNAGYLMYFTAAGSLDEGPENAIHLDERRAVRAIRYLPQGHDMSGY